MYSDIKVVTQLQMYFLNIFLTYMSETDTIFVKVGGFDGELVELKTHPEKHQGGQNPTWPNTTTLWSLWLEVCHYQVQVKSKKICLKMTAGQVFFVVVFVATFQKHCLPPTISLFCLLDIGFWQ